MAENLTVKMALQPGPVVRTIGEFEWSAEAGWEQVIPVELAADLLAYPRPGWSLAEKPTAAARKALADLLGVQPENIAAPGEAIRFGPTLTEVTGDRERAEWLREAGITVKALAKMTAKDITDLSFRSGATADEVRAWVEQAKAG